MLWCSQKSSSGGQNPAASNSPAMDSSMMYEGALDTSGASSTSTCAHMLRSHAVAGGVAIVAATWRTSQKQTLVHERRRQSWEIWDRGLDNEDEAEIELDDGDERPPPTMICPTTTNLDLF
ncbi:hypothetical protein U1Q18_005986 [Sarracenia purpurea var. burkii]